MAKNSAMPVIVKPGDVVVITNVVVGGQRAKLKKPLKVPVEMVQGCELIIERIETHG